MEKELFENVALYAISPAGLLDGLEYSGSLRKAGKKALFITKVTGKGTGAHFRNKILTDLGGGNKVFEMRDGLIKMQIFVSPKDFRKKVLYNVVSKLIENAGKTEEGMKI